MGVKIGETVVKKKSGVETASSLLKTGGSREKEQSMTVKSGVRYRKRSKVMNGNGKERIGVSGCGLVRESEGSKGKGETAVLML